MTWTARRLYAYSPKKFVIVAAITALLVPIVVLATPGSAYSVMVSASSNRTSPGDLSGSTVKGNAYVFVTPVTGVTSASFWLDNAAASGTPRHVEHSRPIDFAGTAPDGSATAWDTTTVADGVHSITVKIVTSSGSTTITTPFRVSNHSGGGGTPKPTTGPTKKPGTTPPPKPTLPPTAAPTPTNPPVVLPAGFIGHSGTQFTVGGKPFVFTGFNIYQANSRSNCSVSLGSGSGLSTALTDIGPGSQVFRAWFFQREATTNGQRDWSAFDHTLAVAKAHGVRVIVTLGNQWGSCESPTSVYKTDAWYKSGYKTDVLPQNTVPYRQFVQEIVTRYKNDPTIAMWQLMNEAEIKYSKSSSCAPTADLYNFAADVSGLIKSIDPNHLVDLGTMGAGQCGSQGSDYKTIHSISTIDVCEYHDYGHETQALPARLVSDIAACKSLGKPIFVGESGIKASSVGGTLAARAAAFEAKCAAMFKAGIGGFLVWSWKTAPATTSNWSVGPGDPSLSVIAGY
jgi:hypothetical protein